jgi:DNA-binding NtrC family response regulator
MTTSNISARVNKSRGTKFFPRKDSIKEITPEQTADVIKNFAKNIRETSSKMREAVRTIRQSGAIDELTEAVREATIAARDTAKDINDTARDLKQRGIIKDTANVIEETTSVARDTVQSLRDTASMQDYQVPQEKEMRHAVINKTRKKRNLKKETKK